LNIITPLNRLFLFPHVGAQFIGHAGGVIKGSRISPKGAPVRQPISFVTP
jgi:hypothetical protein